MASLELGDVTSAKAYFEKALTTPTSPMHLVRPVLLMGSAFVALASGDKVQAAALLREARTYAEVRSMRHMYAPLELAEGHLAEASGNASAALDSYLSGESAALGMGARPLVWQCRAGTARALRALGRTAVADV